MKQYYTLLICILCWFEGPAFALAQNALMPCASDYCREKALQDPIFRQKEADFEQAVFEEFSQKKPITGQADNLITIPVVVHIVHNGGSENISDAQVQQAINWVNQALANQGGFNQGSGTDCGIQLCLAQRTPDGMATNGITRNQSPLTDMQLESQDMQLKNINRWKPKEYLNIWLVKSICSSNYGCGVYGYSYYPFVHGSNIDGVVMEANYLTDLAKIGGLAHEIGHYLGLYHTFEGGCSNNNCLIDGDKVCDTPPDQSTAGVPCGQTVNTCNTDIQSGPFTTDQPDMTWNFMDYGIIACFHDFTSDQSTRMNLALDGVRKSLLESKGCLPPCLNPALASFSASSNSVAVGGTLTFTNTSQNAASALWMIDGITFSTQTDVSYTFPTLGEYTITLQVSPTNSDLCGVVEMDFVVQVYCPVSASFTVNNTAPEEHQTIFLTNTSQNATQNTWFINGQNQGNTLDSIAFDVPGVFEIQLIASNGLCSDTSVTLVYTQEVCIQKTFGYRILRDSFYFSYDVPSIATLKDGNLMYVIPFSTVGQGKCTMIKFRPNGSIIWSKSFKKDSLVLDLCITRATPDGGFAVFIHGNPGTGKNFLGKFTTDGVLEWLQNVQSSQTTTDLLVFPDGCLLLSGLEMIKFAPNGAILWAKETNQITQTALCPDGSFLAMTANPGSILLARRDQNGQVIWSKVLEGIGFEASDLVVSSNGNIFIAGKRGNNFVGVFHGVLCKLSEAGDLIWSKSHRQIPVSTYIFEKIVLTPDEQLVVIGTAKAKLPSVGPLSPFRILVKFDQDGNLIWSRHHEAYFSTQDISPLEDGSLFLTFNASVNQEIVKTDAMGNTISCPESPLQIVQEDYPITSMTSNFELEFISVQTSFDSLNFFNSSIAIDTLCAPACAQTFEICNNNADDDADGLFDCLDPDCDCTEDQCAPKQANIWHFGRKSGLDFSTEPPTVLSDGATQAYIGTATQCDENGDLLFYTDGVRVFNRFHQVMPNGIISITPGIYYCLIIPNPAKQGEFFVALETALNVIEILFVDMALDNGKGDVVGTFITLPNHVGLAGTKLCGSPDYWLLTHAKAQNGDFIALQFGPGPTGIVVSSGLIENVKLISQLKIAPNGHKVACTYFNDNNFDTTRLVIYDFNEQGIGKVSNARLLEFLAPPFRYYGVEFSPDGRFLYVTGEFPGQGKLVQFDLEAGDLAAIRASKVILATDQVPESIYPQLAPNGKIYLPNSHLSNTLDVIHQPNKPGTQCQYQAMGQIAGSTSVGALSGVALCNVLASNLAPTPRVVFPYDAPDTICTLSSPIQYHIPWLSCTSDSLVWRLENLDAQMATNNQNAVIQYLSPGSGRLIVTAYTPCGESSDTLNVLVSAPLDKILNLGPDRIVCQNGIFTFNAGSGFARYLWNDGTADSTVTTLFPGTYWVKTWDLCGNLQTDSITVSIAPNSILNLGPDLPQQCSGFSVNYQRPANFTSWNWSPADFLSCTDCPNVAVSPTMSASWVVVGQTTDGCISIDTLNATIRDTLLFSRDTSVCVGETLALLGLQLPADTTAEFFLPAPGAGCDTLLTIHVLGLDNSGTNLSVRICANAFYTYNGVQLPADTVAIFHFNNALVCDSVVTLTVDAFPALDLNLPQDTSIHIGASVLLEAETNGTGNLDFAWSPSDGLSCITCPDPLASPLDTITYSLAVTDANGCTAQESVTIRVNEDCRVKMPNAFTPNGDGANDVFRPLLDPCVRTLRLLKIKNRWGQTVFEQVNIPVGDPNMGWDGQFEGKPHPSDVLIWIAEFQYFDGRIESQDGELSLIR